ARASVFRSIRRQSGDPRALRADRAHVRAVCGRSGRNAITLVWCFSPDRRSRVGWLVPWSGLAVRKRADREGKLLARHDRHCGRVAPAGGGGVSSAHASLERNSWLRTETIVIMPRCPSTPRQPLHVVRGHPPQSKPAPKRPPPRGTRRGR